jgi:transposase-like protein
MSDLEDSVAVLAEKMASHRAAHPERKRFRWSAEIHREAIALLEQGIKASKLSSRLGISVQSLVVWQKGQRKAENKTFQEVNFPSFSDIRLIRAQNEVHGLSFSQIEQLLLKGVI